MNLTAEQYATIVTPLQIPPESRQGKPGMENRRAPRSVHRCRVEILLADGARLAVSVRDLSARGVGLFSPMALPRGSQFVILLRREGAQPARILCTVMHCRGQSGKLYCIGAEFTCLLSDPAAVRNVTGGNPAADVERIRASIFS